MARGRFSNENRSIEKSRESYNHKPQPNPDTKRKRKGTKTNACKINKRMHEKHINSNKAQFMKFILYNGWGI